MASDPHNSAVYKSKGRPKNPIKFKIQLNEEQKEAKSQILHSIISVITGKAGSGKSVLAANVALDLLFRKEVDKVIITRPTVVAGADIGFLPGDINSKLAPFTAPVYENMYRLYDKSKIEKCLEEGKIEIIPVSFMRGRNFTDCLVIVDESQNLNDVQTELLLTRICSGSKLIFCGDEAQIDLKNKKESGFGFMCRHLSSLKGFSLIKLMTNHRHEIVDGILDIYKQYRN